VPHVVSLGTANIQAWCDPQIYWRVGKKKSPTLVEGELRTKHSTCCSQCFQTLPNNSPACGAEEAVETKSLRMSVLDTSPVWGLEPVEDVERGCRGWT
jgi:hypothetical protein